MIKDRFIAGLRSDIRVKVECKELPTYEDALRVAKEKERKMKKLIQMGIEMSKIPAVPEIIPHVVIDPSRTKPKKEEMLNEEIHEMSELMKNLSLNLMVGRGRGRAPNGKGPSGMPLTSGAPST